MDLGLMTIVPVVGKAPGAYQNIRLMMQSGDTQNRFLTERRLHHRPRLPLPRAKISTASDPELLDPVLIELAPSILRPISPTWRTRWSALRRAAAASSMLTSWMGILCPI